MYYLFINNFKICTLLICFNLVLSAYGISADGAKEIAQNFKHLEGLKEFHLDLG